MKHRFARIALAASGIALLAGALSPVTALGAPIDDKRAQAAQLQRQIDANGERLDALGEQYNGAVYEYERASAQIADAKRRYDEARSEMEQKRDQLRRRAAQLYRSAGGNNPLGAFDVASIGEMSARSVYAAAADDRDDLLIGQLRSAQEELDTQRRSFEQQQVDARARKEAAAAAKAEVEAGTAQQQRLLSTVKGELATLVEQERARKEAAARATALSRVRTPARGAVDPGSVGGGNFPNVPAPSPGVAAVIAYARAQIGKPYVFATAGPDSFDCSGLTMMAWRQAGVSMAHFSGAQFNAFPQVPLNQLQPGDLVFKGPGGVDHVALYIGGGMQIAATKTGDYVRLQPVGRNLSGAVRPG